MSLPKMDTLLREIFLDAYQYLQARQRPDRDDQDYWMRASQDMALIAEKYGHHPLAERLLIAVYEYLSGEAVAGTEP